ncbi:MAG: thioredoxin [Thiohalospira sp.]
MNETATIVDVTAEDFEQQVLEESRQRPVVTDFWAAWCGPCQSLMPVLERLAEEYAGAFRLARVNTDEQQQLAADWGVRGLPTVKVFRHGEVVEEFTGAQPESAIRPLIDNHLPRASDATVEQAEAERAAGRPEEALALLRPVAEAEPDNTRLQLLLIELLADTGRPDEAEAAIDGLPVNLASDPRVERLRARVTLARIAGEGPGEATIERRLAEDGDDLEARYRRGARAALAGDHETALADFLHILQRDRTFAEDGGRKGLLAVFELLGNEGELVNRYRSRLFAALH